MKYIIVNSGLLDSRHPESTWGALEYLQGRKTFLYMHLYVQPLGGTVSYNSCNQLFFFFTVSLFHIFTDKNTSIHSHLVLNCLGNKSHSIIFVLFSVVSCFRSLPGAPAPANIWLQVDVSCQCVSNRFPHVFCRTNQMKDEKKHGSRTVDSKLQTYKSAQTWGCSNKPWNSCIHCYTSSVPGVNRSNSYGELRTNLGKYVWKKVN